MMNSTPTTSLIGKYVYPRDNSYSFTVGTNNCPMFVNSKLHQYKRVLVVSEPYKMMVPAFLGIKEKEEEFITVLYDGKAHVILNCVSEEEPIEPFIYDYVDRII